MATSIDTITAVHHPVRRHIIDFLVIEGPSQVGTLARALGQQVGSISHHLRMLERAGVVEQAPELATDGRTSWWRWVGGGVDWSVEDFVDRPADRHRAEVAERLNFEHHVERFVDWQRHKATYDEQWRRCVFTSDSLARATPEELSDLGRRITEVVREWKKGIDTEDGQEREGVFVFSHGVPVRHR
jgi:DNA-binding transcriptional ArsR family regulator